MSTPNPSKFAQIHASILARKGEARPWESPSKKRGDETGEAPAKPAPSYTPPAFQPTQKPLFEAIAPAATAKSAPPTPAPKPAAAPFTEVQPSAVRQAPKQCDDMEFSDMSAPEPRSYDPERIKKCTIRMTFIDYERLGIIAVKKNVTRQHLLHEAVERCFAMAAEEYRQECACVGNRESCCQT